VYLLAKWITKTPTSSDWIIFLFKRMCLAHKILTQSNIYLFQLQTLPHQLSFSPYQWVRLLSMLNEAWRSLCVSLQPCHGSVSAKFSTFQSHNHVTIPFKTLPFLKCYISVLWQFLQRVSYGFIVSVSN
jgi:hypothetical protein